MMRMQKRIEPLNAHSRFRSLTPCIMHPVPPHTHARSYRIASSNIAAASVTLAVLHLASQHLAALCHQQVHWATVEGDIYPRCILDSVCTIKATQRTRETGGGGGGGG